MSDAELELPEVVSLTTRLIASGRFHAEEQSGASE